MRNLDNAREIARSQGWLSSAPEAFQLDVLDRCALQDFEPGAGVLEEGVSLLGDMFGLVVGHLGVWIAHGRGKPRLVHFLSPGSWFEPLPSFAGQGLRVRLSASRDVGVLRLSRQAMQEIADLHPEAWRLFGLVTAGHLNTAILAAEDLLIRDHFKRCIAVLLRLGGCRLFTSPSSTPVEVELNQQDLATLSNLARTTAGDCPAAVGRLRSCGGFLPSHPHSCAGRAEGHGRMTASRSDTARAEAGPRPKAARSELFLKEPSPIDRRRSILLADFGYRRKRQARSRDDTTQGG